MKQIHFSSRTYFIAMVLMGLLILLFSCKATYNVQGEHSLTIKSVNREGCGSLVKFKEIRLWKPWRIPNDSIQVGNVITVNFQPRKRY